MSVTEDLIDFARESGAIQGARFYASGFPDVVGVETGR